MSDVILGSDMKHIISGSFTAILFSCSILDVSAADLGGMKPIPFSPSPAFSSKNYSDVRNVVSAGITSVFMGVALNEFSSLLAQNRNPNLTIKGPAGFFFNLNSGVTNSSLKGQSQSNLSVTQVPNSNIILSVMANSFGSYSYEKLNPQTGFAIGYQHSFGRFIVGGVLDFQWIGTKNEKLVTGYIQNNPSVAASPSHRSAFSLSAMSVANLRLGWMLSERWMLYTQFGPAFAISAVGAGVTGPTTIIWKQQNKILSGGSVAFGLNYQTSSSWILGGEIEHAKFKSVRVRSIALHTNRDFFAFTKIRPNQTSVKLSIGRQL